MSLSLTHPMSLSLTIKFKLVEKRICMATRAEELVLQGWLGSAFLKVVLQIRYWPEKTLVVNVRQWWWTVTVDGDGNGEYRFMHCSTRQTQLGYYQKERAEVAHYKSNSDKQSKIDDLLWYQLEREIRKKCLREIISSLSQFIHLYELFHQIYTKE